MVGVAVYLIVWALGLGGALVFLSVSESAAQLSGIIIPIYCVLFGALGGVTYCLRGLYLNVAVKDNWDPKWKIWYFVRPLVSAILGGLSFVFVSAGLLVLDAADPAPNGIYGFIALSFVAGLNVDGIVKRIEEVAQATWGLGPSRTSKRGDE